MQESNLKNYANALDSNANFHFKIIRLKGTKLFFNYVGYFGNRKIRIKRLDCDKRVSLGLRV